MSDHEDFNTLAKEIRSINKYNLRQIDMPIEEAIKEGEIMAAALEEDRQKFEDVGFEGSETDRFIMAVGALRYAQANYTSSLGEVRESAQLWYEGEDKGTRLKKDILAAENYALKNVPKAMKAIRRIRKGSSDADLIMDLASLAEVGKKYLDEMRAINFDIDLLNNAESTADELGRLHAKAFVDKDSIVPKLERDQAFTFMRHCMSEVLCAAEYVFRNDRERLAFFHSRYRSTRRNHSKSNETVEVTADAAA